MIVLSAIFFRTDKEENKLFSIVVVLNKLYKNEYFNIITKLNSLSL